mmetsp:Transcript_25358/g.60207  ORF Transcript_25358/g.60207 Transcript_25358/m.60207 type:complete len:104 (+) Transcript_25358:523-834(+)|eukprot:2600353-Rhodomonas_salina.1
MLSAQRRGVRFAAVVVESNLAPKVNAFGQCSAFWQAASSNPGVVRVSAMLLNQYDLTRGVQKMIFHFKIPREIEPSTTFSSGTYERTCWRSVALATLMLQPGI